MAVSVAPQLKAESTFQGLAVAMRECPFVHDTSSSELENLQELDTSSALHQNVAVVLADLPHGTCSTRGRVSSAHNLFCEREPRRRAVHEQSDGFCISRPQFMLRINVLPLKQDPLSADENGRGRGE